MSALGQSLSTADLSDRYPDAQAAEPMFLSFGGLEAFHGQIETLKVFEDNAMVRTVLEESGLGRILVVDGGGSRRCALVGGALGELAVTNEWKGVVVYGCVRDTDQLRATRVGIRAIGAHPRKSTKGLHAGRTGLSLAFAGIRFSRGDWLYADADGILVSREPLHLS